MIRALYFLFLLSGAAGLIYESIWTRYLGLFVGHDAYAQIIVLVIFLGGMSLGSLAVSRRSQRLPQPLHGYIAIEFVVGCIGLFFHDFYLAITSWAYQTVYPHVGSGWLLNAAKWAIAGSLILPQSILLGATFPLMSAGALRLASSRPGRTLSVLYCVNSLGAAVGVLVAGFWLLPLAGLPGTLLSAAMLNLIAAAGTVLVVVRSRATTTAAAAAAREAGARAIGRPAELLGPLPRLLLFTSFGTAVASFIYEIDWIRMLALVLGSATHSFELMLSAFILGLALGSWWIRNRADRLRDPLRTLGIVQWSMGLLALATLPLYARSFGWTAALLTTFARTDAGYVGFTLARYALCLAVMLPATFCAGMTLPLITRLLLREGAGERAIGAVYGWNTLGSIVGVAAGGLLVLPALGIRNMLIAGAALDIGIGVLLLRRANRGKASGRWIGGWLMPASVGAAALVGFVAAGPRLDPRMLASGVFRTGRMSLESESETQFYRDGRTSTVSVLRSKADGSLSLATNGKPDASLSADWSRPCGTASDRRLLISDAATQTLLPLVTLAHAPQARYAAVIGHGSGMSSHFLLASPALRELTTIEIEPEMIDGSRAFYPSNRRAFDDPRSRHVIEDAKSYFASTPRRYDLIMSEPSNPWVSGVSGLFTTEFYARVRNYLTDDGVFGQWLHVYELDDGLVLSVIAAIHQNFPAYEIYLVPEGDMLIVASKQPLRRAPDWSVIDLPGVREDLCRFVPITPQALQTLHIAGRRDLAPLLDGGVQPNSDFYPVLDLGAERRRFRRASAGGFQGLSGSWSNLLASTSGTRLGSGSDALPVFPENPRLMAEAVALYLRTPSTGAASDSTVGPIMRKAAFDWQTWQAGLASDRAPSSWEIWSDLAGGISRLRTGGATGSSDEELYRATVRFMERHRAPDVVRDVVAFRHGVAVWNFAEASAAADRLLPVARRERRWIGADELRDGAVVSKLHLGDIAGARQVLDTLASLSTRPAGDLRSALLRSYVESAERRSPAVAAVTL